MARVYPRQIPPTLWSEMEHPLFQVSHDHRNDKYYVFQIIFWSGRSSSGRRSTRKGSGEEFQCTLP